MPNRLVLASLLALAAPFAIAAPIATATSASAQDAREYQYRRAMPNVCPRGQKFAAGACVRRCPAGYQDMGRRCQLRNQSRGG
jgi:hypothetical protein